MIETEGICYNHILYYYLSNSFGLYNTQLKYADSYFRNLSKTFDELGRTLFSSYISIRQLDYIILGLVKMRFMDISYPKTAVKKVRFEKMSY